MREYTEQEYREVLGNALLESPFVDAKMEQAYQKIRKAERNRRRRSRGKMLAGFSAVAAAFVLFVVVCAANPALAAKLPLMRSFFQDVEEKVSYKGDYSSRSVKWIPEETEEPKEGTEGLGEGAAESKESDSPYIQRDNGVTVTLGEVYCNDMAVYIGIHIQTEEPLPKEYMEDTKGQWEFSTVQLQTTAVADMTESGGPVIKDGVALAPNSVEGTFEDDQNFTGIIRIDASEFVEDLTPGYDGWITEENWDEHFRRIGIPDKFQYQLNIEKVFYGYNWTGDYDNPGETIQIPECVEGNWNFTLDIEKDNSDCLVKEINETDANGYGIAKITKTPYEIQAEAILPEGESIVDYVVVIRDAQGKPLESQGDNAEVYSIYNRDVSKVTVYICDYITYMDECKGENWENLPGKAAYAKEIMFDE
ncbi:MAG: DUF4179 domain-containing protein [Roseburia sp.]|nr:DUF4179 domain-containing protein [Roseburia sp.]